MGARSSYKSVFDPLSLGAVSAWFRTADAVDSGAGLAFTLPNVVTVNHATTTTDARKPTISTSANGLPILVCNTSCLQVPLHAGINDTLKWWIAFHIRLTSAAGNPVPFSIDSGTGGASARKLLAIRAGGDLLQIFNSTSLAARNANPATIWTLNTWVHTIFELNLGTGGAEATRAVIRKDGIAQAVTFSNGVGTPNDTPTSMPAPTGFMNLFAQAAATGANGLVGEIGPNIIIGNNSLAGATSGCLTDAAALALSNFERPTS
jgi:hypothetical protein